MYMHIESLHKPRIMMNAGNMTNKFKSESEEVRIFVNDKGY